MNTTEKAEAFAALHDAPGAFALPNPWDSGSARLLEHLGARALATSSAAFANTLGRTDGHVTLDEKLSHCREIAAATSLPVNADLENGFGHEPEAVARCIERVAQTGVVGGSIEDFPGDEAKPGYDRGQAVERIAAAVEAARACPFPFTLTARCDLLLHGVTDLDEVIGRLAAFAEAGADVVYAPGLTTLDAVRTVADAVDRPQNVLGPFLAAHSLEELAAAGAKRVSVGSALALAAWRATLDASRALLDDGRLGWVGEAVTAGNVLTAAFSDT